MSTGGGRPGDTHPNDDPADPEGAAAVAAACERLEDERPSRKLIAAHMAARHPDTFTAAGLADDLGFSTGTVYPAMEALAEEGVVEPVDDGVKLAGDLRRGAKRWRAAGDLAGGGE